MEGKSRKILNTISSTYFYCKVDKDELGNIIDLIVEESNYCNEDIICCRVNDLMSNENKYYYIYSEIIKTINENKEYKANNVEVKWASKEYIVIWVNDEFIKETILYENELRNQKKLLDLFIDSMTDYIFYKDTNGNYLNCNKRFCETLNMKREDIIGKNDDDLYDDKNAKKYKETDAEAINNGTLVYIDECKLRDGSLYVEEAIKVPYYDQDNNIAGIIGVVRDVSYKRAVKDRLKSNEDIFSEILNHLDDAVIIKEGEKTIFVNDAFEKIYGISSKEVYDCKSYLVSEKNIHPEDRHLFEDINFDEPLERIARIIRADNEIRWVWFRSNPLKDENGTTLKRIIIINDITNRVIQEKELDRLRMEFFANISHEFNTPINLIVSSLQLLKLSISNSDAKDKRKYLNYIESCNQNTFRMIKLTTNLIDSIKIDEGLFRYNPVNIEIVNFVEELCFRVGKFANEKSINIIFDTEFEEKLVYFDPEHMERIILNVFSNGIKFNNENGEIDVMVSERDGMIEISVKDNGVGISKDNLLNIFDRVKMVNSRMTKISEGCGIGLYIAKSLTKMHRGDLKIKSELGVGTEVIIKIPDIVREKKSLLNKECSMNIDYTQLDRMKIEFSDIYM